MLTLAAGTPLVFAALGELVVEKSGVLNLGVEGHDARRRDRVVHRRRAARSRRGSAWAPARSRPRALSLIFAVIALTLRANQVATGLALSLFGIGLSAFVGRPYMSVVIEGIKPLAVPGLSDLPVVGKLLFGHNPLVYVSLVLFVAVQLFLYRTRAGLVLRAVGESPQSAHAIGYPVIAIRYAAVAVRRRMRGPRRRVPRGRVHAVVGRGHDGGPRLDRARARRVRDLEAVARDGRRVSVRQRDARAIPGAGGRRRRAVATARDAAVSRDDRRARDHLARRDDDPAERARVARQAVPSRSRSPRRTERSASRISFRTLRCVGPSGVQSRRHSAHCRRRIHVRRSPAGRVLATLAAVAARACAASLRAQAREPLKIGFIYVSPIGDAGWTHQHDIARIADGKEPRAAR